MAGAFSSAFSSAFDVGTAATVVTDTHDGGPTSRREYEEIRRRIRKVEDARQKSDEDRIKAQQRLRTAVERAYRRVVDGLPDPVEAVPEIIQAAKIPTTKTDSTIAPVMPDFAAMSNDLDAVQRLVAVLEERARDEEDVEILLLAMA